MSDIGREAIIRLEAHEKECLVRYQNIQETLNDHKDRFDKLESKSDDGFLRIERLMMYGGTFVLGALGLLITALGLYQ
ncbi:hypothetical protein N8508_00765 [bacterium]|nr:hypothetical protein [bacterium]